MQKKPTDPSSLDEEDSYLSIIGGRGDLDLMRAPGTCYDRSGTVFNRIILGLTILGTVWAYSVSNLALAPSMSWAVAVLGLMVGVLTNIIFNNLPYLRLIAREEPIGKAEGFLYLVSMLTAFASVSYFYTTQSRATEDLGIRPWARNTFGTDDPITALNIIGQASVALPAGILNPTTLVDLFHKIRCFNRNSLGDTAPARLRNTVFCLGVLGCLAALAYDMASSVNAFYNSPNSEGDLYDSTVGRAVRASPLTAWALAMPDTLLLLGTVIGFRNMVGHLCADLRKNHSARNLGFAAGATVLALCSVGLYVAAGIQAGVPAYVIFGAALAVVLGNYESEVLVANAIAGAFRGDGLRRVWQENFMHPEPVRRFDAQNPVAQLLLED